MSVPKIKFAIYGYGQYNTGLSPCFEVTEETVNVTAKLNLLLESANTFPFIFLVTTANLGLTEDPAPFRQKSLTVFYADTTPPDNVVEGNLLTVQDPFGTPYATTCPPENGVLSAWWGLPVGHGGVTGELVNVSDIVHEHARYSLSLKPTQSFFTHRGVADPASGRIKTLLVWWNCISQGSGCSGPQTEAWPFTLPANIIIGCCFNL